MFSAVGSKDNIYTKIDKLDEVKTVKELVATLKPILNELAYYAVTGDGAVMEMHETWHNTFTDYIYEATPNSQPRQGGQQSRSNQQSSHQPNNQQSSHQQSSHQQSSNQQSSNQQFSNQQQLSRPDPRNMPFSLKSIMNGTHSSFNEN